MRACTHLRSREKDGGYAIRSATAENPMLQANIMVLCVIERELLLVEVLHCGNGQIIRNRPFGGSLLSGKGNTQILDKHFAIWHTWQRLVDWRSLTSEFWTSIFKYGQP